MYVKRYLFLLIFFVPLACKAGEPTREAAVEVLKQFAVAMEARDFQKALSFFKVSSDAAQRYVTERDLAESLERREISVMGADILARQGDWGKLDEVFAPTRAQSWASRWGVDLSKCYGLSYKNAEAGFYWDGAGFKVIRMDDIGALARYDEKMTPPSEAAEREELISYSAFGLEFEYPSTMTVTPKETRALKSLTVEGEDPLRVIIQMYPKGTLAWKVEEAVLSELRSVQSRGAEILESSSRITVRLGEVCPVCQGKALKVRIAGETMHTWIFAFMLQDAAVAVVFQNALKEGQPFYDEEPARKLFHAISRSLRQKP